MKIQITIDVESFAEMVRVGEALELLDGRKVINRPTSAEAAIAARQVETLGAVASNTGAPPQKEEAPKAPAPPVSEPPAATQSQAPNDGALMGAKTLRQLIRVLQSTNPGNRIHMLLECNRLKAEDKYPALEVVPDDALEDRVFSACDSMGIA